MTAAEKLAGQWEAYRALSRTAQSGDRQAVVQGLIGLLQEVSDGPLRARLHNDLGVVRAAEGDLLQSQQAFREACALAPDWSVSAENLARVNGMIPGPDSGVPAQQRRTRVGIVSLLFNWPSTGGGTVHTAELARFLSRAGYEVRHFVASFAEWSLGQIADSVDWSLEQLHFNDSSWNIPEIQRRFGQAVRAFDPDYVIVADSWNSKPLLAKAVEGYPFYLRMAAQECLCPLNNVRLLFDDGQFHSCPRHQLATPGACCGCVSQRGHQTGVLHQLERELVNYGTREYDEQLRWAFAQAEAVLVVNPLAAAMVSPYARRVCVVPSGFDASRFPDPTPLPDRMPGAPLRILFAGMVEEPMKGFEVLLSACEQLRAVRQDFELVATADPPGQVDPFTRFIGWQSQEALPHVISEADILVFPTIAEEALGRTAVEAMGAGRPVVASRIGGLQFTVIDGATGLLFEPGNVADLAQKLSRLLDDPDLRRQLGRAGRQRFEEHYTWEAILSKHYRPLLGNPMRVLSAIGGG